MKHLPALSACLLLVLLAASCASSTMDSVPTVAELAKYEQIIRARMQPQFQDLDKQLASGSISREDYNEARRRLEAKVSADVNDAAWKKHFLAESVRKADGVPTPDAPVRLQAGVNNMSMFYQPMTKQNFGNPVGVSGTAGMGSMSAAREQFYNAQSISNDAMSAGGSFLSKPPPGSIYDQSMRR